MTTTQLISEEHADAPAPVFSTLLAEQDPGGFVRHMYGLGYPDSITAGPADATTTIVLPEGWQERLQARASSARVPGRFAHQPLGPGAPTVVDGTPAE